MLTVLLTLLVVPALLALRGGWWSLLLPITVVALVVDILANYTELSLITWDRPRSGEYTFSKRLKRLVGDSGWRGRLARKVAGCLNFVDPGHV